MSIFPSTYVVYITMQTFTGSDVPEYLIFIYEARETVIYDDLESEVGLLPHEQFHLVTMLVFVSFFVKIAFNLCCSHDAVTFFVDCNIYDI